MSIFATLPLLASLATKAISRLHQRRFHRGEASGDRFYAASAWFGRKTTVRWRNAIYRGTARIEIRKNLNGLRNFLSCSEASAQPPVSAFMMVRQCGKFTAKS